MSQCNHYVFNPFKARPAHRCIQITEMFQVRYTRSTPLHSHFPIHPSDVSFPFIPNFRPPTNSLFRFNSSFSLRPFIIEVFSFFQNGVRRVGGGLNFPRRSCADLHVSVVVSDSYPTTKFVSQPFQVRTLLILYTNP